MKTTSWAIISLTLMSAITQSASAYTRMGRGYTVTVDENVEIGFTMKLFGGANEDALSVAQGTSEFAYDVEISSAYGELKCVLGKIAAGPTSAKTLIKKTDLALLTNFKSKVRAGEEVVCQADEDRKLQVTYRIPKNIAENVVAGQIQKTLEELKKGTLNSEYSRAVLNTVLDKNFKTLEIKAGRAEVIVLDGTRKANTPMIGVLVVKPMSVSGTTVQPSGKKGTTSKKNIYPLFNRFALTCGYVNEKDGTIKTVMVPLDQAQVTLWTMPSAGMPFGCIVNNSADGFDAIDPYVEDPFFTIRYMMMPEADFKAGLEKVRFQVAETVDLNRAEKLEKVASNLLEVNRKRVQVEMDRRRMDALKAAGYPTEYSASVQPKAYSFSLSGKPRYSAGKGVHAGELKADTIFDAQGEKVQYELTWSDGRTSSFSEDHNWTELKGPLVSQDYSTKYSHFVQTYHICADKLEDVRSFLSRLEHTPNTYDSTVLLQMLAQKQSSACQGKGVIEKRLMKYVKYEGGCFVETPYRKNNSGDEMIRFKATLINLVYVDSTGNAVAKVPLDLSKMGNAQNLFQGLDVVTTLPYSATRAATYKLKCDPKTAFPISQFKTEQLNEQVNAPGFSNLVDTAQIETRAANARERAQKALAKPVDPKAGTIDLLKK